MTMESQWTLKKMPEHSNNISLEQYQQSIAVMNSDLHDIQEDIQKLAEQQNQIQVQTMQAQQILQAQQIANILNQQYSSQQNITGIYHPLQQQQQQQFGSTPQLSSMQKAPSMQHHQYINDQGQYVTTPLKVYSRENSRIIEDQYSSPPPSQYLNHEQQKHIAKYVQDTNHYRDQFEPQQPQFYLHGEQQKQQQQQQPQINQQPPTQTPPQAPTRRTWSQKPPPEMSSWSIQAQQQQQQAQLQQQQQQQTQQPIMPQSNKYDTWKISSPQQTKQTSGFVLHSQNNGRDSHNNEAQRLFPVHTATPPKTPKSNNLQPSGDDMMAPQSISFIADEDDVDEADNFNVQPVPRHNGSSSIKKSFDQIDEFETSLGKLNITSGSRTYRIPSPTTRHVLADNSFQSMESQNETVEKGFYISFDNDIAPKRPKPPLRTKRSPKKSNEELRENEPPQSPDSQEENYQQRKVFTSNNGSNHMAVRESPIQASSTMTMTMTNNDAIKPIRFDQPPRLSSIPKENKALIIDDVNNVSYYFLRNSLMLKIILLF